MDWAKHNLVKHGDVVSIAAWQEFEWLKQGFNLRSAGNIDYRFGNASEARNRACESLGIKVSTWTDMQQVHGKNVQDVESGTDFAQTDGMITDKADIALAVVVADCVPLLFLDPVKKIIGVAHAGRRGTELGIAQTTFKQLLKHGSRADDIQVAIGPSIGPCCYEINRDTHEHFDLWAQNEQQLREVGVQTIIRTDICTKDHNDLFFSHRADQVEGRFSGLIGMV